MMPVRPPHAAPSPRTTRAERLDPQAQLAAEDHREFTVLCDLIEQQRKRDDEFLRACIELI